jgi:AcrR family transcriptional regulator
MAPPSGAREATPRTRLLRATLSCARRDGVSGLSVQRIAAEAGVSKALVLYHFRDKEDLLAQEVDWLTSRVAARERGALVDSTATSVMEDLWQWLEDELARGELLVLAELTRQHGELLDRSNEASLRERFAVSERTLERVFGLLELTPRVPTTMLATVHLAFVNGLSLLAAQREQANHRITFDVFWLSLLNLVE